MRKAVLVVFAAVASVAVGFTYAYATAAAPEPVVIYRVHVATDYPADQFAAEVAEILNDPRGWPYRFKATDGDAVIDIVLAGPELRHDVCTDEFGFSATSSCSWAGVVWLNAGRWEHGGSILFPDLDDHRAFLVNHEVGHALGHRHVECPGHAATAPVMMPHRHSEGWAGMGGCVPNAWPSGGR